MCTFVHLFIQLTLQEHPLTTGQVLLGVEAAVVLAWSPPLWSL